MSAFSSRQPRGTRGLPVPRWFPIAGLGAAILTLVFFMAIVWKSKPIGCDQRFPAVIVVALGAAMSSAFLGGWATASGRLPISATPQQALRVSVGGGVAVLVIVLVLGSKLYACTEGGGSAVEAAATPSAASAASEEPAGQAIVFEGWSHYPESGFVFASHSIVPWDSGKADLLVSRGSALAITARFFVQHDEPPYTGAAQDHAAQGGIIEMPSTSLDGVSECPVEGYRAHWADATEGSVYCVRTRDGAHYAKIKVTKVLSDRIAFAWVYQPSGSRRFSAQR